MFNKFIKYGSKSLGIILIGSAFMAMR